MSSKNEVLGYWTCDAGGRAEVFQTKRKGHHFYTRCDCCGVNQATGPARQSRIWSETEFIAGATVIKPSNVTDDEPKMVIEHQPEQPKIKPEVTEPKPVEQSVTEPDFDPEETEEEAVPSAPSRLPNILAGVALIGGAIGGWLWTNKTQQ